MGWFFGFVVLKVVEVPFDGERFFASFEVAGANAMETDKLSSSSSLPPLLTFLSPSPGIKEYEADLNVGIWVVVVVVVVADAELSVVGLAVVVEVEVEIEA